MPVLNWIRDFNPLSMLIKVVLTLEQLGCPATMLAC